MEREELRRRGQARHDRERRNGNAARPETGSFDAGVLGPEFVVHLMRDEPDTYALVGEPLLTTLFGLAFKKEDTATRDAVAQAIDALIADGTYAEILKKYGLEKWAMASTKIDAGR